MNAWLLRWKALAPREQWLTFGGGLAVLAMFYLLLVGDPLTLRERQLQSQLQDAQARLLEAQAQRAELQRRLAEDPNLALRSSLLLAQAEGERLLAGIEGETALLIDPPTMRKLLEDLLQSRHGLALRKVESFSAPLQLPEPAAKAEGDAPPEPVLLYQHGVRLELEGGYFELLDYLQAIQASGWKLHWQRLDYQVGEDGAARASIRLELYTLSRHAGWVGV